VTLAQAEAKRASRHLVTFLGSKWWSDRQPLVAFVLYSASAARGL